MSVFFILSKILYFLTTPINWIFGLLLWAFFTKNPSRKRKVFIAGILVFFFFTNGFIFDEFSRKWEYEATNVKDLERAYEVGIVLGGYSFYMTKSDQINFFDGADRIMQAVRLKKLGKIDKILLAGGTGKMTDREIREADHIRNFLLGLGIDDKDILVERESNNTRENALYAKNILDSLSMNSKALLITSSYHMRRSKQCFDKVGLETDMYVVDGISGPRKYYIDHLLIPNAEYLRHWNALIHEILGFIVYWILGYV